MLQRSKISVEYQQQRVFRAIGTKQINRCRKFAVRVVISDIRMTSKVNID
jgi:hypothetical protein